MQVHAVPEHERAHDSTGRVLPWAYEYAGSDQAQRRMPEEKGPFGKARKRGASRSKTGTPARREDQAKVDNLRVIDDLFARQRIQDDNKEKESLRLRKSNGPSGTLPISASAPNLLDAGGLGNGFNGSPVKEPTEVMLWGYGNDVQWAAIDYFEKVSNGLIFEEYDRQPPSARYNLTLSHQKASSVRALSKPSLRKINEYVGGDHWIKVTFDSPEAAERACHYSPHVIQGFVVSAQRYLGRGPSEDVPVHAQAGSRITSQTTSPNGASSTTMRFGTGSSSTISSATATTSMPAPSRMASEPLFRASGAFPTEDDDATIIAPQQTQTPAAPATTSSADPRRQFGQPNTLRVKGAKQAVLLPPERAFLPGASRWQQTFGSWPIIGYVVGANHGIIGDQVPRKEDGSFDFERASVYWQFWHSIDQCFGTDFCGFRQGEYDD